MPKTSPSASDVAHRRARLRLWLDTFFDGSQSAFIADAAQHGHDVNQGELSGLLNKKSFGEKKARSLEKIARMSPRWLDSLSPPSTAVAIIGAQSSPFLVKEPAPTQMDQYTALAVQLLLGLSEPDRRGAVANLRLYIDRLDPTSNQDAPAPTSAAA